MLVENVLAGALLFWIVASIGFLVKRKRKGQLKLGLREWFEGFVHIFGFLWLFLFLMVGVLLLRPLVEYFQSLSISGWFQFALPWAYFWGLLALFCYLLVELWKWKPKYTEEEKAVLLVERLRFKKKLGWFGRFIKIKEANGSTD